MADVTKSLDETIPGGDYLAADGTTHVDAWGKPIGVKTETATDATAARKEEGSKPVPKRTTRKAKGEG